MSDEQEHPKTPQEKLDDVISRLKEMEHYSRSNIEKIGEDWFYLDDELKKKDLAKSLGDLLDLQNKFQEGVLALIEAAEETELDA